MQVKARKSLSIPKTTREAPQSLPVREYKRSGYLQNVTRVRNPHGNYFSVPPSHGQIQDSARKATAESKKQKDKENNKNSLKNHWRSVFY